MRNFRREGHGVSKNFKAVLSCAKSIMIIVGLLQGIKNPLGRRASEVLKNITEQIVKQLGAWRLIKSRKELHFVVSS